MGRSAVLVSLSVYESTHGDLIVELSGEMAVVGQQGRESSAWHNCYHSWELVLLGDPLLSPSVWSMTLGDLSGGRNVNTVNIQWGNGLSESGGRQLDWKRLNRMPWSVHTWQLTNYQEISFSFSLHAMPTLLPLFWDLHLLVSTWSYVGELVTSFCFNNNYIY